MCVPLGDSPAIITEKTHGKTSQGRERIDLSGIEGNGIPGAFLKPLTETEDGNSPTPYSATKCPMA